MSSTTTEITPQALVELVVPDLATLTDAQVAGLVCVWGSSEEQLTDEAAVDLGERMTELTGSTSPMRWFPRGCRAHVGEQAYEALFAHTMERCEQCRDSETCDIGQALLRLFMRRGWL